MTKCYFTNNVVGHFILTIQNVRTTLIEGVSNVLLVLYNRKESSAAFDIFQKTTAILKWILNYTTDTDRSNADP